MSQILKDLFTVIWNCPLLFYVGGDKTRNKELRSILKSAIGNRHLPAIKTQRWWKYILPSKGSLSSGSTVIKSETPYGHIRNFIPVFINGILTDKSHALHEATLLAHLLKTDVLCQYNPTRGFCVDFVESILGRTLDTRTSVAIDLYRTIKSILKQNNRVVIFAHSQGGIIATNAIDQIIKKYGHNSKTHEMLERIDLVLFGSGDDGFKYDNVPVNVIRVKNDDDFVAHLSVFKDDIWFEEKGHHFGTHYLGNLIDRINKNKITNPILYNLFRPS